MPTSVHVLLRVYGFAASKEAAVAGAVSDVLEAEGVAAHVYGPVGTDPAGLAWASDPRAPLEVTSAKKWVAGFEKAVARAVRASGGARATAGLLTVDDETLSEASDLRAAMASVVKAVKPPKNRATPKKRAAKKGK